MIKNYKSILNSILLYGSMIIFLSLILTYGWMGFWVGVGISLAFLLVRLILSWDLFINSMRTIEMMVWGKPLDKAYWQKEKPKIPKIKWKKDKLKK